VVPFHDEDEVIERANNTRYGLAATVWTENLAKAHKIAQNLQCGYVWINCFLVRDLRMPFGGNFNVLKMLIYCLDSIIFLLTQDLKIVEQVVKDTLTVLTFLLKKKQFACVILKKLFIYTAFK